VCNTIRDRGEAEAQNARTPAKQRSHNARTKPNSEAKRAHQPNRKANNAHRIRIENSPNTGRPPPNPGGYGPFPIYPCQAPNGWLKSNLWIANKVMHI
jgi:hypothetical protein